MIYIFVVVMIGYSFWIAQTIKIAANTTLEISNYNIGAGLTSVAILFLVLAGKGVIRDEKLVKSADRLR
jgi:tellurite resistance protein TehA-like permease